jgi:rod shape-determining protein MreD
VCQTTLVPQVLAIRSIPPEWPFILAVHYALWGAWPDAAIAAWILGLTMDLCSLDGAPVHAFGYGVAAWAIIRMRHVLFRDHPMTHAVVTFVFALGVQLLVGLYRAWRLSGSDAGGGIWGDALAVALYTALWAPPLHWALLKLRGWTRLGPRRRRAT